MIYTHKKYPDNQTPSKKRGISGQNQQKNSGMTSDTERNPNVDSNPVTPRKNGEAEGNVESRVEKRAQQYPSQYRSVYLRAMEGRSRDAALRAHCIQCMGFSISEVAKCTDPACALFQYRPGVRRWKRLDHTQENETNRVNKEVKHYEQ